KMHADFYLNSLYPLQDRVLKSIEKTNKHFYLTGGTAVSRVYLHHRFSDDLDLFVNRLPTFQQEVLEIYEQLVSNFDNVEKSLFDESFVRLYVVENGIRLKIELINDVGYHFNGFTETSIFNRIDNWQNILSNKITALSRQEGKDCADIIFIALSYPFVWSEIIEQANLKDMWVNALLAAESLSVFPEAKLRLVNWITEPDYKQLMEYCQLISRDILFGEANSLYQPK
ncbi:MAG: nucleotidyl transferase AbiEii/AbiGii toxin family protein, partial [Spirosomaceae bacterium]|nr:nucleotidyl transferase AbiEii/AbiGii toxin family protein [Spirosomataceae bacterium]